MPKIGAHVSAAVSLELSLDRAKEIGAQCTQIFVSPPLQWAQTTHSQEEIDLYTNKLTETGISPNFIHGTYLVNLGTDKPENLEKGINFLIYALNLAEKLKIDGVIFHTGSHKGRGFESVSGQIIDALRKILSQSNGVKLLLENCAGTGGVVGKFNEIGEILKKVGDDRLGVCLDTQHSFAMGYDLSNKEGLGRLIKDLDREIGFEKLWAVHCNDSKVELSSNRDRHANIGEGFIGREGIGNILNHPRFSNIPFILEVPGFSGNGPDQENIDILSSLISTID